MALNPSGPISLAGSTAGQSIATELSLGATTEISLNDTVVRTLAAVPSGQIRMPTDFWGKSSGPSLPPSSILLGNQPLPMVPVSTGPQLIWTSGSGGISYAESGTSIRGTMISYGSPGNGGPTVAGKAWLSFWDGPTYLWSLSDNLTSTPRSSNLQGMHHPSKTSMYIYQFDFQAPVPINQYALLNFTPTGVQNWGYSYYLDGAPSTGVATTVDPSGNYYQVGTNPLTDDGYIAKIDSSGNIQWARGYGNLTTTNPDCRYEYVSVTPTGGVYATYGQRAPAPATGNNNIRGLRYYDASGVFQWEKSVVAPARSGSQANLQGDYNPVNNTIVYHYNAIDGTYAGKFPIILKLDSNGNILWGRQITGSGTVDSSVQFFSTNTPPGAVYTFAQVSSAPTSGIYVFKWDSSGVLQYQKRIWNGSRPVTIGSWYFDLTRDRVRISGSYAPGTTPAALNVLPYQYDFKFSDIDSGVSIATPIGTISTSTSTYFSEGAQGIVSMSPTVVYPNEYASSFTRGAQGTRPVSIATTTPPYTTWWSIYT